MTDPERTQSEQETLGVNLAGTVAEAHRDQAVQPAAREVIFGLKDVCVRYDGKLAVDGVGLDIYRNQITALIGPSGCGKSTLIRCLNRMNDLIPAACVEGEIMYHGQDLYAENIDPVEVRKRIGMVFQKPNPFPKSVYDNIAFGPRILGMKGDMDEIVERALRGGALWDEVKDRLDDNAFGMSGGQQQRLCIARCLAVEPDVILMDEPCSALDPISTGMIEDLMHRAQGPVLDRHRHPQHAAGGARLRHDRVPDRRARLRGKEPVGAGGRVRPDGEDLHQPLRPANRGLRVREGRLMAVQATRVQYQGELEQLEARALEGLELVIASIEHINEAVQHQDVELAELVIASDDVIDGRYLEVHQSILTLLATQAPVASDLRLMAALLHVMKCMERMGDQCVNVAKLIPIAGHEPPADERMLADILTMGRAVREQVRQAKRAFADRNVELARDLVRQDDVVDNLNRECFRLAIEIGTSEDRREWAMTMLLMARALERIGDNAVDIGEQVAFLVTGLFREFEDASHPSEGVPQAHPQA